MACTPKALVPWLILGAIVLGLSLGAGCGQDPSKSSPTARDTNTDAHTFTLSRGRAEASDAKAKAAATLAASAMEVCAVDNGGVYKGCTMADLVKADPSLKNESDRLTVHSGATTYSVTVAVPDTGNAFTVDRNSKGATTQSCTKSGKVGCPAQGDW